MPDDAVQLYIQELTQRLAEVRVDVANRHWDGETIPLDGYRFTKCRFTQCTLVFRFPHFELINCTFDQTNILPERLPYL